MKKFFATTAFIAVFAAYAFNQYLGSSAASNVASTQSAPSQTSQSASQPIAAAPQTTATVASTQAATTATTPASTPTTATAPAPTPAPTPAPKPKGQYIDGSYTGSVADAYYGSVQVRATISGGRLTDVAFLQYPNDRSTSRYINGQAMPLLTQEALQAQSAQVSGVSGASDTSYAFVQSLSSALAQAKS